jgi:hypothetical protein
MPTTGKPAGFSALPPLTAALPSALRAAARTLVLFFLSGIFLQG